ncbi:hypothetical protein [Nocardia xishanensis]|uniref:Uncharacterized protein n=1 Tax=Nocardia xishanensis TaxID=238964 RepID=A0ABW7XB66_9NOCA
MLYPNVSDVREVAVPNHVRRCRLSCGSRAVTAMKLFSAALHLVAAVGLHRQLCRIAVGTPAADPVRCWSMVMSFALAGAAGAMLASACLGREAEHVGAQRSWNVSLLLQLAGSAALWVALTTAA